MSGFVKAAPVIRQTRVGKTPIIHKISATSDRLEGGALVEIKGKNFTPDTIVVVGDAVATDVQITKGKKIKFTVPPQKAPGMRTLSVWTPNGIAQKPFQILPKKLEELADREITTIAGGIEYQNDGLDQMNASFYIPTRVVIDKNNNIFVADTFHHRIRRIDARTGIITTIAGNGRLGFSGDNGVALAANLSYPSDMVFDLSGNLLFADSGNRRIRQINLTTGIIDTFAGNGEEGFSGDGGMAQDARFRFAEPGLLVNGGIAVDGEGNVYIADTFNSRVRRVDSKTQIITTCAGGGSGLTSGDG
ncbi:MAG TPA: IPT/TIG domain-containing protein, partial [Acidobacteriota bacterium]|nr:IPT/TIG domain-containing protein [Acidobacteriota bacterium]